MFHQGQPPTAPDVARRAPSLRAARPVAALALLAALLLVCAPALADDEDEGLRDGLNWVAIPLLSFNEDQGLTYGVKLELVDFDKEVFPYHWNFETKLEHSTTNRHQHRALFDLPRLGGSRWRLTLRAQYLQIDDANYFGVGNDTPGDAGGSFNRYGLTEPRASALMRRDFDHGLFAGAGLLGNATFINAGTGRLLGRDRPLGFDGGVGLLALVTAGLDTRDDELVPTEGVFAEVYLKGGAAPLGSTFTYGAAGAILRGYIDPIEDRLVLAQRLIVEHLAGEVPFYEMQRIGASNPSLALGGVFSQRGFVEARFIGPTRVLSNSELRLYFPPLWDKLFLGVEAFFDASRVVEDDGQGFFQGFHPSGGGGAIINWKDAFVFRMDYGLSAEGGLFYVEGRHMF